MRIISLQDTLWPFPLNLITQSLRWQMLGSKFLSSKSEMGFCPLQRITSKLGGLSPSSHSGLLSAIFISSVAL